MEAIVASNRRKANAQEEGLAIGEDADVAKARADARRRLRAEVESVEIASEAVGGGLEREDLAAARLHETIEGSDGPCEGRCSLRVSRLNVPKGASLPKAALASRRTPFSSSVSFALAVRRSTLTDASTSNDLPSRAMAKRGKA